jgi:hypothetical protein
MKISDERIPQRNAKSYSTGRGRPLRLPPARVPDFLRMSRSQRPATRSMGNLRPTFSGIALAPGP